LGGTFGFIGLGNMGRPMAGRLMDAGNSLVVFDTRDSAVDPFVERGAARAGSVADLASRVDTVFLSLPTPSIVERVALGDGGLASGGTLKRVVDLSTTGPRMAASLAEAFSQRGVRWIDSPVSGGVGGAKAGTLAVMYSGPREDFDALQDQLKAIGKPFYIGPDAGLAQTMKLVNNMLSAAAMALTSEAVVMGAKAGLDPDVMIDVINAGSGRNTATMQKFPQSILPRSFDYGFSTGLMHKDVDLFMKVAAELGLSPKACGLVNEIWDEAERTFGADSDFTHVVELMEKAADVTVRGKAAKGKAAT
jgi:3-hydroxyisobutyrate dehydrogenase-like beta-hydroxyacid dehydrogenase